MTGDFGFSVALDLIVRNGMKLGRREWKNARFVFLVDGSKFQVNRPPLLGIYPEGTEVTYRPHIDMCGADGSIGTWAPSMVDLLAEDWYVVTDEDKANVDAEEAKDEVVEDAGEEEKATEDAD